MADPDKTDDFTADPHRDLDPGEGGMMADADYYDRIGAAPDNTVRCPSCGHAAATCDGVECYWCPEGYCEDRAGTAKAENDFAADLPDCDRQ